MATTARFTFSVGVSSPPSCDRSRGRIANFFTCSMERRRAARPASCRRRPTASVIISAMGGRSCTCRPPPTAGPTATRTAETRATAPTGRPAAPAAAAAAPRNCRARRPCASGGVEVVVVALQQIGDVRRRRRVSASGGPSRAVSVVPISVLPSQGMTKKTRPSARVQQQERRAQPAARRHQVNALGRLQERAARRRRPGGAPRRPTAPSR